LTAILAIVALATVGPASADPNVDAKRAEAQNVLAQIQEMDGQLGLAIEAYNLANVKLDRIQADLKTNARHLTIARSSLKNAQTHLADRLVALYVGGGEQSALEVVLGAESLEDLLNRLETVERVSEQDTRVLREVTRFRAEVKQRKAKLQKAQKAQKQVVASRASQKAAIEGQLAERQRLLASIRDQIATLEAAERRRQERLAAQARARFAAAQQPQDAPEPRSATFGTASSVEEVLAPPAPPSQYGGVVGIAMQYLGVPYRWGGASPETGFDCSGFSMYVYAKVGVSLPHHAATQFGMGVPVSRSELEPGDLVFFHGLGHMGIYVGGDSFIHAPRTGDVVKISSMSGWYANRFVGARRIL
jgi:cell wall-associated NlpC family hydrolase